MTTRDTSLNMRVDIVFIFTCSLIATVCSLPCDECRTPNNNLRIKRAKYYSSPPQRFYKRPPMSAHGAFSYTPPPNYMMDDDEQAINHRPSRHSRPPSRPANDGLGEEDINNLIKYLSKKDLDKIVEYAVEKDKYRDSHVEKPVYSKPEYNSNISPETPVYYKPEYNNNIAPEKPIFSKPEYISDNPPEVERGQRFPINGPYAHPDASYNQPTMNYPQSIANQLSESSPIRVPEGNFRSEPSKLLYDAPLDTEESMRSQQFAVLDAYIQQDINGIGAQKGLNIFTDGKDMKEEQLPAPLNLRQGDYDASFTNNVPAVVKADSSSYQIENFGNLPLMNYNSKLDSVSSYKVPHYTVTTPNQYQPAPVSPKQSPPSPLAAGAPPLELAPPVTKYRDQSDAHLKATKIWTHKSKGTAYYLHSDGSLSLERPLRPKPKYG